jgi:hypothetical protein
MSADEHAATPPIDEEYHEVNTEVQSREPQPGDWGFFSCLDRPACCGGGVGGFSWFDDQQAMYAFIHDYFAWAPVILDGPTERNETFGPDVQALFDDESLVADESRLREAFNEVFTGEFQIRWWGPFSGLLEDAGELPSEVRASFWQEHAGEDDEAQRKPIPGDIVPEFVEFIRYYGV